MEVIGSVIGAIASTDAADTQAAAADRATQAQRDMFDKQVELQQPWRQTGIGALNQIAGLLGIPQPQAVQASQNALRERLLPQFTRTTQGQGYFEGNPEQSQTWVMGPSTTSVDEAGLTAAIQQEMARQQPQQPQANLNAFFQSPGYQFRQDEGMKALQRSAAARGGLFSGRAGKDMLRFSQGLASDEFGQNFNRLASVAGLGQTATNQMGAAAGAFANQAGSNILAAGNTTAAGQMGVANALSQGLSSYQQRQMMGQSPLNTLSGWQAKFSQTPLGGSGFGTGRAYGEQDLGLFL